MHTVGGTQKPTTFYGRAVEALGTAGRSQDGSMTILALFFFIVMIMIGGLSVDIMIHENNRLRLQNVSDRAAIAAADMSQRLKPEDVVRSYFEKEGLGENLDDTIVEQEASSRSVKVVAHRTQNTMFMNMTGTDRLTAPALAKAIEGISEVEISMVLDVSNSMNQSSSRWGRSKLDAMKNAADRFVDAVMDRDLGSTSISLVPYSTQVNMGADIAEAIGYDKKHPYSQCLQLREDDFSDTTLRSDAPYKQAAHFDQWYSNQKPQLFVCRPDAEVVVEPILSDRSTIKRGINNLTADGNTSIEIGMKWGMAMLDPSFGKVTRKLVDTGKVDRVMEKRPLAWGQKGVDKFVVLLTDGVNTEQKEIEDKYASGKSGVWRWKATPLTTFYSIELKENGDEDWDGKRDEKYWIPTINLNGTVIGAHWDDKPLGSNLGGLLSLVPLAEKPVELDWTELWAEMTVRYFAHEFIYRPRRDWWAEQDFLSKVWTGVQGPEKDDRLLSLCDKARTKGVTVYTIGFQVTDYSATVLSKCAATPNHFIRVVGDDLEGAFDAIATNISKLKLIQ